MDSEKMDSEKKWIVKKMDSEKMDSEKRWIVKKNG